MGVHKEIALAAGGPSRRRLAEAELRRLVSTPDINPMNHSYPWAPRPPVLHGFPRNVIGGAPAPVPVLEPTTSDA